MSYFMTFLVLSFIVLRFWFEGSEDWILFNSIRFLFSTKTENVHYRTKQCTIA